MDADVVIPGGITVPNAALSWRFSRGTGPGGQSVNTTDSRVELTVDLTALRADERVVERVRQSLGDSVRIVVTTERSQLRNRGIAIERLVERLEAATAMPTPRIPKRPTRRSVAERLDEKHARSQVKAKRRSPSAEDH